MKTKLLFSLVIFLTVAAFIFEKKSINVNNSYLPSPPVITDSEFLINVMHSGIDINYDYYPQLGTNAWHIYCGPDGGWPDVLSDNINTAPSVYGPTLIDKIEENRSYGFRSIMERPRTVHLAYSQRSEYQCETLSVGSDYWFYAYDTHQTGSELNDYDFNGNGARVRYCQTIPNSPGSNSGYVVKDLRANREQANKLWTPMHNDDTYEWFVMPRMRIDTSTLQIDESIKVCAVVMIDWNGDVIDSVDIIAKYFRDENLHYNGNYIEEYNFPDSNLLQIYKGLICPGPAKQFWAWGDTSVNIETDFRVYWYGLCDMWIDYVKVENKPAHEFFNPTIRDWNSEVRAEADFALSGYDADHPIPNNFYLEEFEFNMVPSIKRFNELVRNKTDNKISMMVNLNYPLFKTHIPHSDDYEFSAAELQSYLISRANLKYLVNVSYPLEGFEGGLDPGEGTSEHPNTLSNSDYSKSSGILSYKVSVSTYDDWLQQKLDFGRGSGDGFIKIMKKTDSISRYYATDLNIIHLEQAHLIWLSSHKLKEPSNEEMMLMANLAITYGSKGIMYFAYNSENDFSDTAFYQRGLVERISLLPRTQSVYGQDKWEGVKEINNTIKNWSPYIMSFDNENRRSYIYRIEDERNEMSANTYINKLKAYPSTDITPDSIPNLSGMTAETNTDAYLQAAFFQKINETEHSKYFMIVNRRCSPFINYSNTDNLGGRRFVSMKINPSHLTGFSNWKIFDLETGDTVRTLSKSDTSYIFLGDFMPGEGKLYRIAPVMQEGGTLVADESIDNINFNCNGDVNNGGKNISLYVGTTVNFADGVKWNITGGEFKSGLFPDSPNQLKVNMKSQSGAYWNGIDFTGCAIVTIANTIFESVKLSGTEIENPSALLFVDCYDLSVSGCKFNFANLDSLSCLYINYLENEEEEEISCNLLYNEFNTGSNKYSTVICAGFAESVIPLMINGNDFNSTNGNNAILLSGVAGGAIKDNIITGYNNGIILIWSAIDLYGNIITGGDEDSKGVISCALSYPNLAPNGFVYTGGYNFVTCEGENAKCLEFDNSYSYLNAGYNIFNLNGYEPGNAFHIAGTIPDLIYDEYGGEADAINNCFRISSIDTNAVANVESLDEEPFYFIFTPYYCGENLLDGMIAFDLGNGMYDTIYTEPGGSGGSISGVQFPMFNGQSATFENLSDSVSINLRKRDYERVSDLCYQLLTDHIDSLKDVSIILKLYLAELRLDSSGNRITNFKSFLEALILNNPEKVTLVKQSYYVIQKCKVSLGMYESAMTGFQEIVNQNPYSYEGLVAGWDYAATSLLSGGQGGGDKNLEPGTSNLESENPRLQIFTDDPYDKYDSKRFDKEDRKAIRENIINSFQTSRDIEIEKVKSLEKKVREGNAGKNERSELKVKKILSEVIKIKKPRDITEHINNVNGNIQKVFGAANDQNSNEIINIIPTEYNLSQNYPNPFNPTTKINFSLPEDGKIKLIVYDILGREVKRLINSEFRSAGKYTVEFNGAGLSSGVYFYRIEAGKYVQTKRMVLIK